MTHSEIAGTPTLAKTAEVSSSSSTVAEIEKVRTCRAEQGIGHTVAFPLAGACYAMLCEDLNQRGDARDTLGHHSEDLARLAVEVPAQRERVEVLEERERHALRDAVRHSPPAG